MSELSYIGKSLTFDLISVNEDPLPGNRISAKATRYNHLLPSDDSFTVYMSVDEYGNFTISKQRKDKHGFNFGLIDSISIRKIDMDSLLQFITEGKIFVEESKIIHKLTGSNDV
jgi:hypothetical protein